MRRKRISILAVLLAAVMGAPAAAQSYDDCVAMIETDPVAAERQAHAWAQADGGAPAKHCQALAMLAQGAEQRAAALMVEIAAGDRTLPDRVRADLFVEAGEVFLDTGRLRLAEDAVQRAILLIGPDRAPLTLGARIKAERKNWRGAVGDLDQALAEGAPDAGLLVLRASAKRRLGELVEARSDLIWAEELAPELPSLWLERGSLAERNKDRDAARAAWLKAIDLDRDGPVGKAAQLRLQRMDSQ